VAPTRYAIELEPEVRELTVFRKTRQVERAEVERALLAQQVCAAGHEDHGPAIEVYERKWSSGTEKR
jgi:hypothetical protein